MMGTEILKIDASRAELFTKNKCANLNDPNCSSLLSHRYTTGISWPIVDNLLFHYASHHNVLEKVVMYETEVAAQELRAKLRNKEDIVESLAKELEDLRSRKSSYSHYSHAHTSSSSSSRDKRDSDVKDDIQGMGKFDVIVTVYFA